MWVWAVQDILWLRNSASWTVCLDRISDVVGRVCAGFGVGNSDVSGVDLLTLLIAIQLAFNPAPIPSRCRHGFKYSKHFRTRKVVKHDTVLSA
jgi:hypothetical protein